MKQTDFCICIQWHILWFRMVYSSVLFHYLYTIFLASATHIFIPLLYKYLSLFHYAQSDFCFVELDPNPFTSNQSQEKGHMRIVIGSKTERNICRKPCNTLIMPCVRFLDVYVCNPSLQYIQFKRILRVFVVLAFDSQPVVKTLHFLFLSVNRDRNDGTEWDRAHVPVCCLIPKRQAKDKSLFEQRDTKS